MARKDPRGGGTPATVSLTQARIPFTVHLYDHDPAVGSFGMEAAEALRISPDRVFKTLFVSADDKLAVGVVPVSGQLDLKAIAAVLGAKKATMAEPADAERASGYVVGGISPIGQRRAHRIVLDESALSFESIFVSGGRRGMDLEMAPGNLVKITGASTASIRR